MDCVSKLFIEIQIK